MNFESISQKLDYLIKELEIVDDEIKVIMNKYRRVLIQTDRYHKVRTLIVDSANAKRYLKGMADNVKNLHGNK